VISLNGTTEKIQIVPGTVGTIDAQADFVDLSGTTVTPGSNQIDNSVASSAVDLVASPAASTSRRCKYLGIRNTHATVTTTMLVQKIATGPLTIELFKTTLLPGWELIYNGATWFVYDANGAVVTGPTAGRFLRSTLLTSGTSFTTGVDTESIRIRVQGAGGGGGGCTSVASAAIGAGGGGAGAYAERVFDVLPNSNYAYTIGAAGTGVSGAAGNNGGNSTFVVGGTTVTAPGGTGAPVAAPAATLKTAAGGAGGTIATNGDVNQAGPPGEYGVVLIVATPILASGAGGDSVLGAGGLGIIAVGSGNNATGYGGGGGGSATGASTVRTGGNGTQGCVIVEEYT
jgi:hypothetical protein